MRMNGARLCDIETRAIDGRRGFMIATVFAAMVMIGCGGPVGPFSGGRLSGDEAAWPIDMVLAANLEEIALETAPTDPHSVNVWVVVVGGDAFIATSLLMGPEVPEERAWVRNISTDPNARVRFDDAVYSVQLVAIDDDALIASVLEAFQTKYPNVEQSRGAAARFFRISKR